jgi:hypothetical protein
MKNIIKTMMPTLITSMAGIIITAAVKMIIYNKGRALPKDYSISKIISKVSQSYNNYTEQSDNIGIRAIFDAREAIISDLNRLTPSDYTVKIPKATVGLTAIPIAEVGAGSALLPLGGVASTGLKKAKKALPLPLGGVASTGPESMVTAEVVPAFDIEAAKDLLEKGFIAKYPNLRLFKGLFFSLDSKLDTLKFIQQVLIKVIKYSFYPLVFVTLYIYFLRITG